MKNPIEILSNFKRISEEFQNNSLVGLKLKHKQMFKKQTRILLVDFWAI